MGKNSPSHVLKTVFQDISNVESVIKDSKKIQKSYDTINFDNQQEVQKIIADTKIIVDTLKDEVLKIDGYFDENYKAWQNQLIGNSVNQSNEKTINFVDNAEKDVENEDSVAKVVENEDSLTKLVENEDSATKVVENEDSVAKVVENEDLVTKVNDHNDAEENEDSVAKVNDHRDAENTNTEENVSCGTPQSKTSDKVTEEDKAPEKDNEEQKIRNQGIEKQNSSALTVERNDKSSLNENVESQVQNKTNINEDNVDTPNGETNDVEDIVEPKVFLKCVDIKKLIKPNLKSPSPTRNRNDSILIISDSDQEIVINDNKKKPNKSKTKGEGRTRSQKSLDTNRSVSKSRKSRQQDKVSKNDSNKKEKKIHTRRNIDRKKVTETTATEVVISSDDNSNSTISVNKTINKKKSKKKTNQGHLSLSDTSSGNDSENTMNLTSQKNRKKNLAKVKVENSVNNKNLILDAQSDKKFSYKAYVPLPRVPCEKLRENYVQKKELMHLKRLTNLSNLKKRPRKSNSREVSDQDTPSEVENNKPKLKRKRNLSRDSHASSADSLDNVPAASSDNVNEPESNVAETEMDDNAVKMMLDDINSGSDMSAKESESEVTTAKAKKRDKKSHGSKESEEKTEEKGTSSTNAGEAENKAEKSKWRRNKLLTTKISESDSEDEFEKFKRQNEKAKEDVKARLCKKKKKVVISSDSDSEDKKKEDKKKNSDEEEFKPSKKNSSSDSSSNSESEKEEDKNEEGNETKKRRRIKRVNDSSSDEDGNKTTRKTIRRVIAHESLAEATKRAEKDERERKARIAERQKKYNRMFEEDKPEDATVDKLVLDFNEETKEEILVVHKDLVKKLKPHQAKGVQFMWDSCYESVERAKKTEGSGSVLAHCMGLGKTLQVITLVHTLLRNSELTGVERVLVVCPLNTVLNWVAEFNKWLDDIDGPEIDVYELISNKQNYDRQYQVELWTKHGGVLVMGYDMFRNLTNPNNKRLRKKIRDTFHKGLVNPGPDLVVCDEGHLLKNEKTNLSIAMNRIHTVRRIVLTGTPMQNNLKEYYCMVQFVKPNLLGTYKEYLNRFVNPITNGQYTDSTLHDITTMRRRSHVLHKLLDGIVQRKDYSVLTPFLPPKHEYVLFLTLSEVQIQLYQHYKDFYSQRPVDNKLRATAFLFADFQEFQRICTHPRVLLNKSEEKKRKALFMDDDEEDESEGSLKDFIDDDDSDAESTASSTGSNDSDSAKSIKSKDEKTKSKKRLTRNSAAAAGIDVEEVTASCEKIGDNEWWGQYCDGEELDNIAHSSKLYLLFTILQECELIGDKLLVFSQSLYSLDILEYFLAKIDEATQKGDNDKVCGFSGSWALGLDYFRLDGSSSCDNRAAWCKSFNSDENPRARLFLISTKAGGLGINLVGANRVIIFDVSWNPSHDIQSIYRVYRFGQIKPCYIYRFVTWGTMEMKIYERQVTKQAISKRVIDEQQIDRHYNQNDLAELYRFDPKPTEQATPLVPKDVLLAELLQKQKDRIYKYHEHQSLLENKQDEELNEAERKAAWEEFENEKTARVVNNMGWIRNLPVASITAALVNIIQRDNPTWTQQQVQTVIPVIVQQLRAQVDLGDMLV